MEVQLPVLHERSSARHRTKFRLSTDELYSLHENTEMLDFKQPEKLHMATGPDLGDLCSVVVTVPGLQRGDNSPYQPHVVRCRELIFTESDILATPVLSSDRTIQIIMQQSLFRTGRLQARFKKMAMEVSKPRRVTPGDLQACLRYTLLAKLAPLWNKAGDLLIQGREFISSAAKTNAIRLDVTVTEKDISFHIEGQVIKAQPLKFGDLDVSAFAVQPFFHGTGEIQEHLIESKWCYVLPSMKRGQVVRVLRSVPPGGPFNSYKDIKRYWKNTYGYRLPDTEEGMLYCQLYFKPIGDRLFTYPMCCLRPREPCVFGRVDAEPIVLALLEDVAAKLPSVCGVPLRVARAARCTTSALTASNEIDDLPEGQHCNLADVSRVAPKTATYHRAHQQTVGGARGPGGGAVIPASLRLHDAPEIDTTRNAGVTYPERVSCDWDTRNPSVLANSRGSFSQGLASPTSASPDVVGTPGSGQVLPPRVIPMFKARSKTLGTGSKHGATPLKTGAPRQVPCFRPKAQPPVERFTYEPSFSHNESRGRTLPSPAQPIRAPAAFTAGLPFATGSPRIGQTPRQVPYSLPTFPQRVWADTPASGNLPTSYGSKLCATSNPCQTPQGKRKLLMSDEPRTPQKAKTKSKVQDGLNVALLATTGQLSKANGLTLLTWLKERGVACKVKDKKADLIHKVQQFLNLKSSEA